MLRISQISSHLVEGVIRSSATIATSTPHQADRDVSTITNDNMAKTKVVVTRQLIDEAQDILNAKKSELEIVQWNSEKVCRPRQNIRETTTDSMSIALRSIVAPRKCERSDRNPCHVVRPSQ
jgi:hypothetical protein